MREMGSRNVTHDQKHGKRKNQIIRIDGVGGLVVLGGAMAVTVVMVIASAFSGKKTSKTNVNLKKDEEELVCGCSSEDDVIVSQRLSSLDQHSKPTHKQSCCRRCDRPKSSTNHEESQFMSGRSTALDKLAAKSNDDESPTYDHQEIFVLSDDSRPETVASGDYNGTPTDGSPGGSPGSSISDNPYFNGEKLDGSESPMSQETAKVKDSFEETENESGINATTELYNVRESGRSSETKSTLRKRQGMTMENDGMVKEELKNGGAGRTDRENTTGLKILNREAKKKSMALRMRMFFMILLSIPFLILFITCTATFFVDNHSSVVIPWLHQILLAM